MNPQLYVVIPERANPRGYFLLQPEKELRWHVEKVFRDAYKSAYYYRFTLLNAQGKPVTEAAHAAFARSKGLTQATQERAAAWFLTRYFSFRELHYSFSLDSGPHLDRYYPVLGRYDRAQNLWPDEVHSYQKRPDELHSFQKQSPQKPVLEPQDFELSWE